MKRSLSGAPGGFLTRSQLTVLTAITPSSHFIISEDAFTGITYSLGDSPQGILRCSLVELTMISRPGSSLLMETLSLRREEFPAALFKLV
ncbi:hypothetical protein FOXYSP1_17101 [Fusarium oxysporum f. sp. phaseoli]